MHGKSSMHHSITLSHTLFITKLVMHLLRYVMTSIQLAQILHIQTN